MLPRQMLCRENASFCLLLIHNYLQRKAEFFGAHVQLGAAESILSYIAAKAITPWCWHTQLLMPKVLVAIDLFAVTNQLSMGPKPDFQLRFIDQQLFVIAGQLSLRL